jgi:hypothetical protein
MNCQKYENLYRKHGKYGYIAAKAQGYMISTEDANK